MQADALLDLLRRFQVENGRRVIRALSFLPCSRDIEPEWFASATDEPENIRVADELLIDLLFAANGQTFDSLQGRLRSLWVDGVEIRTLDIDGLLKTQTDFRDKDRIDRDAILRLKSRL